MSRPAFTKRESWLALLNALTLVALTLALLVQPGWRWPWMIVPFSAALALLTALWWRGLASPRTLSQTDLRHREPIVLDAEHDRYATAPIALPPPTALYPQAGGQPEHGLLAKTTDTAPAEQRGDLTVGIAAVATLVTLAGQCERLLKQQRDVLEHLAKQRDDSARSGAFDPLTGVATHTAFMTRLIQDVAFADQHGRPLALAIFDIADFRAINQRYGYRAGDEVLIAVAERLQLALDEQDLVGRLGGDRFGVVWANLEHGAALARIERVIHAVTRQLITSPLLPTPIAVTLRAGLALCPDDGLAAHALVELATDALDPRAARPEPTTFSRSPLGASPLSASLEPSPHHDFDMDEDRATPETALPAAPPTTPVSYLQELVQRHSGIHALTSALEARDPLSIIHARNLAELAEETALLLGRPIEEARLVGLAVLLHDVGELGIAPEVLAKLEPLSPEEWSFVREHPRLGERLLKSVGGVLAAVAPMVASHRERWDGTGYPEALAGEMIPLGARIVAVCDVFGALISERPYRHAHQVDDALAEIARCSGSQFDPTVVAAFLQAAKA